MTQLRASRIVTTELDAVFTCNPTFHACCNSCASGGRYELTVRDGPLGPVYYAYQNDILFHVTFTSRQVFHCQVYGTHRVLSVGKGLEPVHI